MNIFPTHPDAFDSALALDDKRLVRQASEVVVLLGNVAALQGIPSPYKPHPTPNHPLVKWLLEDPHNWRWTASYAHACNLLYRDTYGRECVCLSKLRDLRAAHTAHYRAQHGDARWMGEARPIVFCNAASNKALRLDFTHVEDVHDAYRQYLNARWAGDKRAAVWSKRSPPIWRTQ